MDGRVEIVIIGCGDVTRKRHAKLCAQAERVHLRGFYNRSRPAAQELAEEYHTDVFDTLEDVLDCSEVDAVLIATPEQTHSELAIRALEAGKHVLCEKPMAAEVDQALLMERTARANGKKLMINFNQRLYRAHQKLKALIEAGEIGTIVSYFTAYETRGQDCLPDGTERPGFYDRIGHRHGVLAQIGCHKVDLMTYLFQAPAEEVFLACATQVKRMGSGAPVPYEDRAVLNLRHRGGITGLIDVSWQDFSNQRSTIIYGTEGTLVVEQNPERVALYRKNGAVVRWDTAREPSDYQEPLTPIVDYFAACILEDQTPFVTGDEGIYNMRVLKAAYRSAREGRWIAVEKQKGES